MIKLTKENTAKAIERSKQLKPKVIFISDRVYEVKSSRNDSSYTVRFDVIGGERFAECECKASERGLVCYHITSAAAVNIMRQSIKRQYA